MLFMDEDKITYDELAPSLQALFDVVGAKTKSEDNLNTNGITDQDIKINVEQVMLESDDNFHIIDSIDNSKIVVYINGRKYTHDLTGASDPKLKNNVFLYHKDESRLYFFKDNDHIIDLEDKIEHLNFHIKNSNNEINNLQSDIITLKTEVENLRIFKTKYYNLMGVHEGTKKENLKLKKNLELFYKENHFAALKIKELEQLCSSKEKNDEEEEIKSITSALVNKVKMLNEEIAKLKLKQNI